MNHPQHPPGPGSFTQYREQPLVKNEQPLVMRQTEVVCVSPYAERSWQSIGRQVNGVAPESVQYSQALRPPGHLTSFLKLTGQSTKGITNTANNTLICVVMEGEVTVMINSAQFVASRGDTFYVPANNTYNLINMGRNIAELFIVQYKTK